jgi:hypothetical protein
VSEPPSTAGPRPDAPTDAATAPEAPPATMQPETTQPFLLAKRPAPAPGPPMRPSERVRAETPAEVARMARRLAVVLIANAALYAGVAASGALRYHRDRTAIPEVVLAVVAAGLALWGALAGHHLWRAGAGGPEAGHELAGAFSQLRSIFVLKGTGLFLVLALACFAFSALVSLAALL